jgi:hypothetical protein
MTTRYDINTCNYVYTNHRLTISYVITALFIVVFNIVIRIRQQTKTKQQYNHLQWIGFTLFDIAIVICMVTVHFTNNAYRSYLVYTRLMYVFIVLFSYIHICPCVYLISGKVYIGKVYIQGILLLGGTCVILSVWQSSIRTSWIVLSIWLLLCTLCFIRFGVKYVFTLRMPTQTYSVSACILVMFTVIQICIIIVIVILFFFTSYDKYFVQVWNICPACVLCVYIVFIWFGHIVVLLYSIKSSVIKRTLFGFVHKHVWVVCLLHTRCIASSSGFILAYWLYDTCNTYADGYVYYILLVHSLLRPYDARSVVCRVYDLTVWCNIYTPHTIPDTHRSQSY